MVFKEFIKDFLAESHETLARLDQDFVAVEKDPSDWERLDSIYGGVHTIKGSAGFFAFSKLEKLAHAGESLLCEITEGKQKVTPNKITALLAMVDAIREMLQSVEDEGGDGANEYGALVTELKALMDGGEGTGLIADPEPMLPEEVVPEFFPEPVPEDETTGPSPAVRSATVEQEFEEDKFSMTREIESAAFGQAPVDEEIGGRQRARAKGTDSATKDSSSGSIRVSVGLLDRLMGLVGELVLARNQVLQFAAGIEERASLMAFQQVDFITTELQQTVMQTRMQPIRNIFSKFPRIVRDLAMNCEKKVRLDLEGEDTELDKSLLEAMSAPLTHVIRNAIDHGIESPVDRINAGKLEEGRLRLSAYHESGHVNIEIADDGAGFDLQAIKLKAIERRLITPEQAERIGESDLMNLIFAPGFSTAKSVSNISGRGIGMDVVRTGLEKIGGTVDVQSRRGVGTTLRIKVPLTLAIIPALIVASHGDRYAIPQINLQEAVRLKGDQAKERIEHIYDTPVYRLRGRLLPVVHLGAELGLEDHHFDSQSGKMQVSGTVNIVVLQVDERQFGLVVDEIQDTQEIVVKPISRMLRGQGCFAGATIMDDGKPSLILDVLKLAQRSKVLTEVADKPLFDSTEQDLEESEERERLLVFKTAANGRMAMPLCQVGRLEIFPTSRVERAGEQEVVQYRDRILPLVRVSDHLGDASSDVSAIQQEALLHVVVYDYEDQPVGLVVGQILDIVEQVIEVKGGTARAGVLGTAVVDGKVTELLDVGSVVKNAAASFLTSAAR